VVIFSQFVLDIMYLRRCDPIFKDIEKSPWLANQHSRHRQIR